MHKPPSWASGYEPVQAAKKESDSRPGAMPKSSMKRDSYESRHGRGAFEPGRLTDGLPLGKSKDSAAQVTEKVVGRILDRLIEAQRWGENVRIPEAFRLQGQKADDSGSSLLQFNLQLIKDLDVPHHIRQGRNTLTCGPATAQAALARTALAEYVRMGKDLATKGQTETSGGKTLQVQGNDVDDRKVGWSLTEDLLQPAMADVAPREWPAKGGEGDVGGTRFGPTRRFGGRGGSGEALTPEQYGGLMAAAVPGNQTALSIGSDVQRRKLNR